MKKLLSRGACLVALAASPATAQTPVGAPPTAAVPGLAVAKVCEGTHSLRLDIARVNGTRETREDKPRARKEKGDFAEYPRQRIAQRYREGDAVTSAYGGGTGGSR